MSPSERAFLGVMRRELRNKGLEFTRAIYDASGHCTECGDSTPRCPGYHATPTRTATLRANMQHALNLLPIVDQ